MPGDFPYDVFLSHNAKDKAAVRPLAERLRAQRHFQLLSILNFQLSTSPWPLPVWRPAEQGAPLPSPAPPRPALLQNANTRLSVVR